MQELKIALFLSNLIVFLNKAQEYWQADKYPTPNKENLTMCVIWSKINKHAKKKENKTHNGKNYLNQTRIHVRISRQGHYELL